MKTTMMNSDIQVDQVDQKNQTMVRSMDSYREAVKQVEMEYCQYSNRVDHGADCSIAFLPYQTAGVNCSSYRALNLVDRVAVADSDRVMSEARMMDHMVIVVKRTMMMMMMMTMTFHEVGVTMVDQSSDQIPQYEYDFPKLYESQRAMQREYKSDSVVVMTTVVPIEVRRRDYDDSAMARSLESSRHERMVAIALTDYELVVVAREYDMHWLHHRVDRKQKKQDSDESE